jgi:hypothetical protein
MGIILDDVYNKVKNLPDEVNKIQGLHDKLSNDIIPNTNKIGELKQIIESLPQDIKNKLDGLPQEIKNKVEEIIRQFGNMIPAPPTAPPAPPLPPPMDPREALRGLAEGIRQAEDILNQKNLVIASGYIDIDIQLKVDKEVGASAKIHIDITPKPYN